MHRLAPFMVCLLAIGWIAWLPRPALPAARRTAALNPVLAALRGPDVLDAVSELPDRGTGEYPRASTPPATGCGADRRWSSRWGRCLAHYECDADEECSSRARPCVRGGGICANGSCVLQATPCPDASCTVDDGEHCGASTLSLTVAGPSWVRWPGGSSEFGGRDVELLVTLTNSARAADPVRVVYGPGSFGIMSAMRNGERVTPAVGAMDWVAAPRRESVTLAPGQSLTRKIRLSGALDWAGSTTLEYRPRPGSWRVFVEYRQLDPKLGPGAFVGVVRAAPFELRVF